MNELRAVLTLHSEKYPGMKPQDAARAGVFIHGAAGDIAALKCGRTSMTVTDLNGVIDMIKR